MSNDPNGDRRPQNLDPQVFQHYDPIDHFVPHGVSSPREALEHEQAKRREKETKSYVPRTFLQRILDAFRKNGRT